MLKTQKPQLPTSEQACWEYLATLDKTNENDTNNAIIRYLVPSIGGPTISAVKRKPATEEEQKAAYIFLNTVPLEQLASSPDLAMKKAEELQVSPGQIARIKRNLTNLVDWLRNQSYLSPLENPIPKGICHSIKVGGFQQLDLRRTTSFLMYEEFSKQLTDAEEKEDFQNAVTRFFVPGTDGPVIFHKPALNIEIKAALQHLKSTPLEYLNEAESIVTDVMKALNISATHQTRIRNSIRKWLTWGREEKYLPNPLDIAPWGGELIPTLLPNQNVEEALPSALDYYNRYREYLQSTGSESEVNFLQSTLIKYLVPAYGGSSPSGKRATPAEIEAGINYLQEISIEQLQDALQLIEAQFELLGVKNGNCYALRSRIKAWLDWHSSQGDFAFLSQQPLPEFNTFYTNGIRQKQPKPGRELHKNRCPVHKLCAKAFPDDYINPLLEQEIKDYKAWRLANDVRPGAIATEEEQILQALGWLHRYEGIPLEQLSLECLISKCQLIFWIKDYPNREKYFFEKEKGTQAAQEQAKTDIKKIQRYLSFVGGHPESQKKRVSLLIAMSKFIYRDLIGSDDYPDERDIPVIRRLLNTQVDLGKKAKSVAPTVSYHETSVTWPEAITAMEKQRRRAEQVIIYIKRDGNPKGYDEEQRPETALANDLQKFLSLAFCLLVPSRSRTFYDLRIDETFKEGILTENKFLSVADLKEKGLWEELKNQVAFYIHHHADDYKTGKAMAPVLMNNGGWWVELPNFRFNTNQCLYDYVRRWLKWGRYAEGAVEHNFFFRHNFSPKPLDVGAWGARIKTMFAHWTGVKVSPGSIRKMFSSQFPQHIESAALLLQHSQQMHNTNYDMRHSLTKMQPVMDANQEFMQNILNSLTDKEIAEEEVQPIFTPNQHQAVEKAEIKPISKRRKEIEKAEIQPISIPNQNKKIEEVEVKPISKRRKQSPPSTVIQLTLDI